MTDIIDRIQYLIDTEGFTVGSFSKLIGVKDQTIRNSVVQRKNKPSYEVLSAICQSFEGLNARWLLTGKGEMFITESTNVKSGVPQATYDKLFSKYEDAMDKIKELEKVLVKNNIDLKNESA